MNMEKMEKMKKKSKYKKERGKSDKDHDKKDEDRSQDRKHGKIERQRLMTYLGFIFNSERIKLKHKHLTQKIRISTKIPLPMQWPFCWIPPTRFKSFLSRFLRLATFWIIRQP